LCKPEQTKKVVDVDNKFKMSLISAHATAMTYCLQFFQHRYRKISK